MAVLVGCHDSRAPADATAALVANATVAAVLDGDTIEVVFDSGGTSRVRLIGIDTPEIEHPGQPAECFGPEAALLTAALVPPGSPVQLQRDIEARDDYGRLLAYVFRSSDGLFVNAEIISRGYATPLRFEPNITYASTFADGARAAEAAGLGLWASCFGSPADR